MAAMCDSLRFMLPPLVVGYCMALLRFLSVRHLTNRCSPCAPILEFLSCPSHRLLAAEHFLPQFPRPRTHRLVGIHERVRDGIERLPRTARPVLDSLEPRGGRSAVLRSGQPCQLSLRRGRYNICMRLSSRESVGRQNVQPLAARGEGSDVGVTIAVRVYALVDFGAERMRNGRHNA